MTVRVDSSAQRAVAVTPNDSANLSMPSGTNFTKGIYVGVSGNIKVKMADSSDITFTGLAAGIIHPISASRVFSTGTTATGIIAVY